MIIAASAIRKWPQAVIAAPLDLIARRHHDDAR
jgi:hypothetical protein